MILTHLPLHSSQYDINTFTVAFSTIWLQNIYRCIHYNIITTHLHSSQKRIYGCFHSSMIKNIFRCIHHKILTTHLPLYITPAWYQTFTVAFLNNVIATHLPLRSLRCDRPRFRIFVGQSIVCILVLLCGTVYSVYTSAVMWDSL